MQITKAQHFVWRKYLENWCVNKQLFTKDLSTGKTFNVNPKNLLKENYIYRIPILTVNELIEIEAYVKKLSNNSAKDLNLIFFKIIKDLALLNFVTANNKNFDITPYEKNGLEDFYTKIENYGKELIEITSILELERLLKSHQDKILTFILFQYMRTQNMRNKLRALIIRDSENIRLAKELLTPIIIANNILCATNNSVKFKILNNQTNTTFITSDQPASNLKKDQVDEHENVEELVVMYPLNPRMLLIIDFNCDKTNIEIVTCDIETILYYNNQIVFNANKFLISSESAILNSI
ncbi:DUF4238 domain-containing protein [Sphingobacterium sp. WM]|uniref:DUF4238 domain-containing protein n=1 Tax=Sphingobacterium sp. WM TaxID=3031802 RepID=UPI00240D5598|nr:DUF4238 domain-containing protein [Sphingobacterium sp. WM]WFB64998.1 DUF4238 domain-containing protein [Sphingobacterium sp. WM]